MSEQQNQISSVAGALTTHQRHFSALSKAELQWIFQNTVSAIALFVAAVENHLAGGTKTGKFLQFLFSFNATAVKESIVRDNFVEGKTVKGVSITRLGENFKKHLLPKTEIDVEEVWLKVQELLQDATDLPQENEPGIISELRGKHRTALAHLFQLLAFKQQERNFSPLGGYITDESGILWTVDARWRHVSVGWCVEVYSVEDQSRWGTDAQIVSL